MDTTDRLMTVAETAEYLNCNQQSLRKWVREKRIPSIRIGKCIRFRESSLKRWIDKQERDNYIRD